MSGHSAREWEARAIRAEARLTALEVAAERVLCQAGDTYLSSETWDALESLAELLPPPALSGVGEPPRLVETLRPAEYARRKLAAGGILTSDEMIAAIDDGLYEPLAKPDVPSEET